MPRAAITHSTTIELVEAVPPEVAVGTDIFVKVKVSCSAGCDLRGWPVKVTAPDGDVASCESETLGPEADHTRNVAFKAPLGVGDHTRSIAFPSHEDGGIVHEESTLPVRFKTHPHATSLAVWSIPSSVVTGEQFGIKVGAKSTADCVLNGKNIEVCDQTGAVVARGTLGQTPWPGTSALYWTDVELSAAAEEGMCSWSVRFEAAELELAHEGSASQFSFVVVRPPEHTLTIKVVEKKTAAPIENVQIRVGAYRGATDQSGLADVRISKGTYDLNVWKVGYEAPPKTVEINADATVEIEVLVVPEDDPDAVWMM